MSAEAGAGSRVRVVVVHFGSPALTLGALRSAASAAPEAELVVVDHGDEPFPEGRPGDAGPSPRVLRPPANRGYGAGCNAGARGSTREFLLFLNNDAHLLGDALAPLVACLDEVPAAAVAAPALRDAPPGEASVHRLPSPWRLLMENLPVGRALPFLPLLEGNGPARRPPRRRAEVEAVLGAAFLVRRSAFELVGGFDEGFFHFVEEDDLFRRLRDAGWKVLHEPAAGYRHAGAAASAGVPIETRDRWKADGFLRYAARHHGAAGRRRAWRALLLGALLRRLAARLPGPWRSPERARRFGALVEYLRSAAR